MKKIIMSAAALGLAVSMYAQPGVIGVKPANVDGEKILTMEKTILGPELVPENLAAVWKNEGSVFSYVKDNVLYESTAEGEAVKVIDLERLNAIAGTSFKSFPAYRWIDGSSIFIKGSVCYGIDLKAEELLTVIRLPEGAADITPSPDMTKCAYTLGNNLYYSDSNSNSYAVTADSDHRISNGKIVSRNEFGITGGIFWSPDSRKIAFYRKDETAVGTFPLLDITTRTGSLVEIPYPMCGMPSENVRLGIYDIASVTTSFAAADDFGREQYLTGITWSPDSRNVFIQVLDRAQKNMHLNMYSAKDGSFVRTLLTEHNDRFVEPQNPLYFVDGRRFLYRTDNRDGYKNLYLCDTDGNVKRFTDVDADVEFVAFDGKYVYYTSAEVSPVECHLFRKPLASGKAVALTKAAGWHNVSVSPDGKYFIDNYSSLNVPRVINVTATSLKYSRNLLTADDPTAGYAYTEIDLGTVKSADGKYDNHYRLIKPLDFDPQKKYPVVVYVYGGPHSQMIKNTWLAELRRWEMYMAQRGYLVYAQDNRGTLNQGAEYEKAIHGQCGQVEMADQMEGVKMLMSLPYVDCDRIGVHGWSYGGFMTISLITNYPDIFKVAVAGGPVIDWKWYEVMYGERYMGSPAENAEGYEKVSLMNRAADLKGKLLICQGVIDNVVLWQHSLSFVRECVVNNVQVDYFPYPRAEHNVLGKDRIHLMDKVSMYFDDYLK